jgi:spermidine synthase
MIPRDELRQAEPGSAHALTCRCAGPRASLAAMRAAILACFLLSGASSLVFELLWTRDLTLVFGATIPAISTVLGVFMAGLALGSALGGRLSRRIEDLPRAYAIAEALIGAYALCVPFLLRGLPAVHATAHALFGGHPALLSITRLVTAALILLPPTTLMGATLPLLSRHFIAQMGDSAGVGRAIGALYAWNTLGAVLGTAVGGFVLLPSFGKLATNLCAAVTNLVLASLVMLVSRRRHAPSELDLAEVPSEGPAEEPAPPLSPRLRAMVLGSFACSGAAAMICQVLWNRALAIVIGSSVYSFTLILLAFLIGLSAGAALLGTLSARSKNPIAWLGGVHVFVGATVLGSYALMDRLPAAFLGLLRGGTFSVDGIIACQFLLAALALLPPTIAMGGVLPITMRLVSRGGEGVGEDVGRAYAINTIGAIVGSVAAGFVVLPIFGLEHGLRGCAGASIVLGLVFFLAAPGRRIARALVAAVPLVLVLLLPGWDLLHFSAGLFRVSIARQIIEGGKWVMPKLAYYKDGTATTVSVEQWSRTIALKNNGKVDASNGDDMATQIMVGLMPFLFHPTALDHPPTAAVIGFGSGVTIGAVTQFPIAHADVVELEPNVVDAGTRFFGTVNHDPAHDPRVRVVIDDGRSFLGAKRGDKDAERYDIIVSEPSNPWISGVSNLFTVDYWKIARARLRDDGVFCQWAQLYEMSPRNVKILLRSFSSVFPYTYVFAAEDLSSDVIMVAANHPLVLDVARLRRNFDHPTLSAELRRGGVSSAEDLIAYLLLTPDELPAFTAGAPLNTDDNALIEYAAPRDLLGTFRYDPYLARVYGTDWPYGRFEHNLAGLGDGPQRVDTELKLARALIAHGRRPAAARFLARARQAGGPSDNPVAALTAALDLRSMKEYEEPLATPGPDDPLGIDALDPPVVGPSAKPGDAERLATDYLELARRARAGAYAHALIVMQKWPEHLLVEAGPDLSLLVGMLLYKAELYSEAVDRLRPLIDDEAFVQKRPAVLYYLARAEYGEAIYEPATRYMERYLARTRYRTR